jgi:photosystem II stability/assembly factor-like uncharacterized protein
MSETIVTKGPRSGLLGWLARRAWSPRSFMIGSSCLVLTGVAGGLAFGIGSGTSPSQQAALTSLTASASNSNTTPTTTAPPATGPTSVGAPKVVTPGGAAPGVGGYDAVTCPSTTSCIAVGADGSGTGTAASSNDDSAWTALQLPPQVSELDAVACASDKDCVAVGPKTIVSTLDGGQTWELHTPPVANTTLLGVTCTAALLCVAVGMSPNPAGPYAGEIVVSTDGGSTWTPGSVPTGSLGVGDVSCPTETRCIAVGATILVSNDSGRSWTMDTVAGGSLPLRSIACSSDETCVAVGSNPSGATDPSAQATDIISTEK